MKKPKIIIVGADKGGVGKTLTTRVLADYLSARDIPSKYFDTEWPNGDLKRFIPTAQVIDISKVEYQMEVFDHLENDRITILDIRAGMLSPTIDELDGAGLLDDVRGGGIDFALLHVLGPTINSLEEVVASAKKVGGACSHYLVKNYINNTTFFEWDKDQETSPLRSMADLTITIPHLTERACEEIQKHACSFVTYAHDRTLSKVLSGKVNKWLEGVYVEFDKVNIGAQTDIT